MEQNKSLYEFLGKAAGPKLGKQVYEAAKKAGVKVINQEIKNPGYSGKVLVYPESFLKEYFTKRYAVLSLSGGMDSSTLLLHLLANGYQVQCISFDYGQKHRVELERATELVRYLKNIGYRQIGLLSHKTIKLDGLAELLNSSLVEGGKEVPEGHYEASNMKETVVENRNMIFSSISQAVALSIANKNNSKCVIALGLHSGDHTVYKDTTEEFRLSCLNTFKIGNDNSHLVDYYTPYMETDKLGILKDGQKCCDELGLDFNEVYKRTNTSYKPYPSGNSDYKSASSVERIEAFMKLGLVDPVTYEDETGIVTWNKVTNHVKNILQNHK